jgi:hypothetical protein
MQIDRRELGEHFASLSNEELLDLKREDLTEAAQGIYDLEIANRGLDMAPIIESGIEETEASFNERNYESDDETADPEWHQEGVIACSFADVPGDNAEKAAGAQTALQTAGIPSHLKVSQYPNDPYKTIEVLVSIRFAMHASSILDRDLFNDEFEAKWREHLDMLSNADLSALDPDIFCAGLLDRVERLKRVYAEVLEKRKSKSRGESTAGPPRNANIGKAIATGRQAVSPKEMAEMDVHHMDNRDPLPKALEWQDHRYDPGYYLGGKIDPMLTARRPNKHGYYLVICSVFMLILTFMMRSSFTEPFSWLITIAIQFFLLWVGIKLIKKKITDDSTKSSEELPKDDFPE